VRIQKLIYSKPIVLRTLELGDATPSYLGWLSDPVINAFLEVRFSLPVSVDDLAKFIEETNASLHTLILGIFLYESYTHIGNIKLGPIDWNHKVGDIGFLLGEKNHWGKGYASKAISMLADYAFTELGLAKLTAGCYAENEGSRRALLKAGFVEEGRRKSQWLVGHSRQDGVLMGRTSPSITG
jgi:[ribosomal protein S5]-alanine N-acetyltransferase